MTLVTREIAIGSQQLAFVTAPDARKPARVFHHRSFRKPKARFEESTGCAASVRKAFGKLRFAAQRPKPFGCSSQKCLLGHEVGIVKSITLMKGTLFSRASLSIAGSDCGAIRRKCPLACREIANRGVEPTPSRDCSLRWSQSASETPRPDLNPPAPTPLTRPRGPDFLP